jgi:hypothetical protein
MAPLRRFASSPLGDNTSGPAGSTVFLNEDTSCQHP